MYSSAPNRHAIIRLIHAYVAALFCLVGLSPVLSAQADTATLSGVVMDATGAYIPGATVSLQDIATGTEAKTSTNSAGAFSLNGMQPGRYELDISKEGFATVKLQNIALNVGDHRTVEIKLKAGTQQAVTVDASGQTMNTTDASVSTVIDRKFVENVPLNGRSFQDLISMTPGIVTQSPQNTSQGISYSGDFSVNGQRTESNYYIVDGVSANSNPGSGNGGPQSGTGGTLAASTALGTTQSLMSVDALQEFRVESSTYSAEYGHGPGGQFSLVTRSGTNDIHGTAFDYIRNNFFDANDWFNDHYGKPISPLRQNDFGGTVGGPVLLPRIYNGRNRTFFFFSYEGLRLTQPQAATIQYVPSLSLRQSAPSILQPILNAFPIPTGAEYDVPCSPAGVACPIGTPTGTGVASGLSPFIEPYSLPSKIDATSVRLDYTFNPKLVVFFRFGATPSSTATRQLATVLQSSNTTYSYTLGLTSQLSNDQSNELRLGYTSSDSGIVGHLDSFGGGTVTDLNTAMGVGGYPAANSMFELNVSPIGSSTLEIINSHNRGKQWNLVDAYSRTIGQHHLKFGVDYRRIISSLSSQTPDVNAFFYSPQSIQANLASDLEPVIGVSSTPIFNETAIYVQDELHPVSNLSFSFGLRWEVNPPPTEEHGNDAYTIRGDLSQPGTLTLAPRGTPLWNTTWYNFAPRLGLAWQAHSEAGLETIVRAGGGVFFDTDNQQAALGYVGLGFLAYHLYTNVPVPATEAQLNLVPSATPPYTSGTVYAYAPHLQLPYTLQWNSSVQQALGRQQAITLSYVGANGRRLIGEQELSLNALNPNFGTVEYFRAGLTSSYNSLQLQFQRTVTKGVQAIGSYTWSHSLDFGSTSVTLPMIRGNSDFDVRSNFQAGLTWNLPSFTSDRLIAKALINNWGIDARFITRTAYPVILYGNYIVDPATGNQIYSGVNYDSTKPLYLYGSQYPGGRAINGGSEATNPAITSPSGTNSGNAPRNFARGFGENQINGGVRREFHLYERFNLQFRAESFNLLNHPNFGYVDSYLGDSTFGQALHMLNSSLSTMASQYQQGGARSLQFALKLIF